MTTGIVYIYWGNSRFYDCVLTSIRYLRRVSALPITVIADKEAVEWTKKQDIKEDINYIIFDSSQYPDLRPPLYRKREQDIASGYVHKWTDKNTGIVIDGYYKNYKPKLYAFDLLPYDQNILVDSDTYFYKSFEGLLTDTYDIGYCKETNFRQRGHTQMNGKKGREWDWRPYYLGINSGFLVIRRNNVWNDIYTHAKEIYERYEDGTVEMVPEIGKFPLMSDQWAFNHAIACSTDVECKVFSSKWNVRVPNLSKVDEIYMYHGNPCNLKSIEAKGINYTDRKN